MSLVDEHALKQRYIALVSDGFTPDEAVAAMRHIDGEGTMLLWPLLLSEAGLDKKQAMKRMVQATEGCCDADFVVSQGDLQHRLGEAGVPESAYSFDSDGMGEVYRLAPCNAGWTTYYAERGLRTSERFFTTELGALRHFFNWVTQSNQWA